MSGRFNPAKEKSKVQILCPSSGGVLRSQEGRLYVPATPVRHFSKPRSVPHVLQLIDKARNRRLQKIRQKIFSKPAPVPIVPYRHKLPQPAVVVTYEQLKKRAQAQIQREKQAKQQHIRQELIQRLASVKQPEQSASVVSAVHWLPLCCGAWVPCKNRYPDCAFCESSDSSSEGSVCSPEPVSQ